MTIVHKGNIMKFTEGAFRDWGYELAKREFGAVEIDGGPWCKIPEGKPGAGIVIKDAIADITLQQVLTRPKDFDVIATLNLNGDYLSRRAGRAGRRHRHRARRQHQLRHRPRHLRGHPRHRAQVRQQGRGQSRLASCSRGEMMLRYLGWTEAADLILKGLNGAIGSKTRHLRLRPPDGRRHRDQVLRVRRQHHRAHGRMTKIPAATFPPRLAYRVHPVKRVAMPTIRQKAGL